MLVYTKNIATVSTPKEYDFVSINLWWMKLTKKLLLLFLNKNIKKYIFRSIFFPINQRKKNKSFSPTSLRPKFTQDSAGRKQSTKKKQENSNLFS